MNAAASATQLMTVQRGKGRHHFTGVLETMGTAFDCRVKVLVYDRGHKILFYACGERFSLSGHATWNGRGRINTLVFDCESR